MTRPTELTEKQIINIADEISSGLSIDIAPRYIADIIDELYMYSDGYEIAKELESSGFNMTSDLVEELNSIEYSVDEQIRANEKNWVKENNITPIYKADDKVLYFIKHHNNKERVCNINGIDFEKAYYKIEIEKGNKNHSALVKFEDLEGYISEAN